MMFIYIRLEATQSWIQNECLAYSVFHRLLIQSLKYILRTFVCFAICYMDDQLMPVTRIFHNLVLFMFCPDSRSHIVTGPLI